MKVAYFDQPVPEGQPHLHPARDRGAGAPSASHVDRFALRGWDAEVTDAEDVAERERTRYVLRGGVGSRGRRSGRGDRRPLRTWRARFGWRGRCRAARSGPFRGT
jgi:hypothetical protein